MNLVTIQPKKPDTSTALEVLDALRARVVAGEIIAFVGIGVEPDDTTTGWAFSTAPVTRLRMMGAIASLQHAYHSGEFED